MKTRPLIAFLALLPVASALLAAGMSREKLLEMSAAKLDPQVIVNMLETQGVDFAVTPDALVELKRAGVDQRVLIALSKMGRPSATEAPSAYRGAADLYRAGKYGEAAEALETHLTAEPKDHPSRALLAATYLRLHKRELANQELERLKAAVPDRSAAAATSVLQNLMTAYDTQEALKEELKSALQRFRAADALAVMDRMKLNEVQRRILRVYLALYQGNFDEAKKLMAE